MGPRAQDPITLFVDVDGLAADARAIDALARLALIARRNGCRARLCHPSAELSELIDFVGLSDALGPAAPTTGSTAPKC